MEDKIDRSRDERIRARLQPARRDSGLRIPGKYVLISDDGVHFDLFAPEVKAYTHAVAWIGGGETTFDRRERPWLILQDGRPTHLVTGVLKDREAWCVVQSLAQGRTEHGEHDD